VRALLWPLFAISAWDELATMMAGTTVDGARLATVLLYGVGSVNMVTGTTRVCAALASVLLAGVGSGTVVAGR
jgi:hypothetical protein